MFFLVTCNSPLVTSSDAYFHVLMAGIPQCLPCEIKRQISRQGTSTVQEPRQSRERLLPQVRAMMSNARPIRSLRALLSYLCPTSVYSKSLCLFVRRLSDNCPISRLTCRICRPTLFHSHCLAQSSPSFVREFPTAARHWCPQTAQRLEKQRLRPTAAAAGR